MASKRDKTPYAKWNDRDVAYLVNATNEYVVFLDSTKSVDWETDDALYGDDRFPDDWGTIVSRAGLLEHVLLDEVTDRSRLAFKRFIGEALARGLEGDSAAALMTLDKAEAFANDRNREVASLVHLQTAASTTAAIVGIVAILAMIENAFLTGNPIGGAALDYIKCAGWGASGALLSILTNARSFRDPYGDTRLQAMEAGARIFVGVIGALLAVLVVRSGVVNLGHAFDTLTAWCALAAVAGASERLVPDLIRKIDGSSPPSESSGLRVDTSRTGKAADPHGANKSSRDSKATKKPERKGQVHPKPPEAAHEDFLDDEAGDPTAKPLPPVRPPGQ